MINLADTDDICSRLEHSNRLQNGLECHALPADKAAPPGWSKLELLDGITSGVQTGRGRAQREAMRKIGGALTYMLQNLHKPVQMSTLGALAGISMSHFFHLFKLATDFTPNDFLIRARMCRACELLRGTDLSVKEVAASLGYDDPFYFSRLFKSVNGVSPRGYRVQAANPKCTPARMALPAFDMKPIESYLPMSFQPQPHQQNRALTKC